MRFLALIFAKIGISVKGTDASLADFKVFHVDSSLWWEDSSIAEQRYLEYLLHLGPKFIRLIFLNTLVATCLAKRVKWIDCALTLGLKTV